MSEEDISQKPYFFLNQLKELKNINILPSKANFVLVELLNGLTSEEVSLNLLIRSWSLRKKL